MKNQKIVALVEPSFYGVMFAKAAFDMGCKVISMSAMKALGIINGPSHVEVKLSKEGPKITFLDSLFKSHTNCVTKITEVSMPTSL